MSYYLSITKSIFNRKSLNVFYFRGLSVFLLRNKEEKYLFDLPGAMAETPISRVIEYIDENGIGEAEILLPNFDEPLIDLSFRYIANYLLENDSSIGLLVEDEEFVTEYKHLIVKYGITYSEHRDYGIYETSGRAKKKESCSTPDGRVYSTNKIPLEIEGVNGASDIIKIQKPSKPKKKKEVKTGLEMDEPFVDILIKLLNESGKNNVDVYTKGGITRQVFSKILCNRDSVPRKDTVICLIIGLELNYEAAKKLLASAGYALSRSIVSDSVVSKYLRRGIFDLDIINEELESRQCALLGWKPREE